VHHGFFPRYRAFACGTWRWTLNQRIVDQQVIAAVSYTVRIGAKLRPDASIYGLLAARMGLLAIRVTLSQGGSWGRWFFVVQLVLLAGGLPANSSDSKATRMPPLAGEPIAAIPSAHPADPAKLALGERLFDDPRLSRDGTRACSSCHDVQTNGARPPGRAVGRSDSAFDSVTVFNAALNFRLNWEGNVRTLEAHTLSSLEGPGGLQLPIDQIVNKLDAYPQIEAQFMAAYG